jgi:pimeloyl-ACP methyl ester carboxylesterase
MAAAPAIVTFRVPGRLSQWRMDSTTGYADINGLHMFYEVHGEGTPLLQLHGGTCTNDMLNIPFFSKSFQVIAPEQMGHGRTGDAPGREFHYHDMAEDSVALLRHLGISSAFVLGFSDGGMLGLDMAIHHPDLVSKLVVTGSNFSTNAYSGDSWAWLMTVEPHDWPEAIRERYAQVSPDGETHWPVVLERLRRMWTVEPNFTPQQLASIKAPTLVIAGDRDLIEIEHTVALFKAVPNSQLCVLPHEGHGALPEETIMAFLTEASEE